MDYVGDFVDESLASKRKVNEAERTAFIMPRNGISTEVTRITQLSIHGGYMYYISNPVQTISLCASLLTVIEFLRRLKKRVVLVAYNGFRFDVRMLIRDIRANNRWNEFNEVVLRFLFLRIRYSRRCCPNTKKS